jgi:predicted GTPase
MLGVVCINTQDSKSFNFKEADRNVCFSKNKAKRRRSEAAKKQKSTVEGKRSLVVNTANEGTITGQGGQ